MRDGRLEASGHNWVEGQGSGPRIDKKEDEDDAVDAMGNKIEKSKLPKKLTAAEERKAKKKRDKSATSVVVPEPAANGPTPSADGPDDREGIVTDYPTPSSPPPSSPPPTAATPRCASSASAPSPQTGTASGTSSRTRVSLCKSSLKLPSDIADACCGM